MLGELPLLVTNPVNVRYLTGFSGSNAVLLVGRESDADLLGTDGRYRDQAAAESPEVAVVIDRATLGAVLDAAVLHEVAIEGSLSVTELAIVQRHVPHPVVAPDLIGQARAVKDEQERELLARACRITADAMDALAGQITVGDTELTVARRLEQLFADGGAEDRAFATIVATGAHAAIPHHRPTSTVLLPGDLLVIDAGAMVDGYHADMTRTFIVGRDPQPWQAELHSAVLESQQAAVAVARAGSTGAEVDSVARAELRRTGYEEFFSHGLGHGVGLQIHEAPALSATAAGTILRDMVFTVEPGAYLPGRGGVRIEDTLVATDAGPRVLTESPRDLRVVGA